jgi:hypothetical protein
MRKSRQWWYEKKSQSLKIKKILSMMTKKKSQSLKKIWKNLANDDMKKIPITKYDMKKSYQQWYEKILNHQRRYKKNSVNDDMKKNPNHQRRYENFRQWWYGKNSKH